MSIKKIALIFLLGIVAALSIRSLQADPRADKVFFALKQPTLSGLLKRDAKKYLLLLASNAKKHSLEASKFLGKCSTQLVNYVEAKSSFNVAGITVNPIAITKNTCSFVNNHKEGFATAAVIFGSLYIYNKHKKWRRDNIQSLLELKENIKALKGEKKINTGDLRIRKSIALAKKYRRWTGFKHRALIIAVKSFFRDNPILSDVKFSDIVNICVKEHSIAI